MVLRGKFSLVLVAALFLTLFSSQVYADNLNHLSFLELDSKVSIPVKFVSQGSPSSLEQLLINYSWLPSIDYRQSVISIETYPDAQFYENYALFEINNPMDFYLTADFQTRTLSDPVKVRKKIEFPIKELSPELVKYTEPTELIDINQDIRELANSLANDEDDLYVVVFKLADWVNTNINYSLSTVTSEASLPSSWVLDERRGVCDEISNLFISMSRSLGIPARFVSGIAYTESELFSENWGAHGWAEVYFPGYGWVPFDPTYNQLGYVDATHIKLNADYESNKYSTLYSWSGRNIDVKPGELKLDIDVLSRGPETPDDIILNVDVYKNVVGFGSYNVITAEVTNVRNYYVSKAISITRINDVEILGELTQDILLKPSETKKIFWIMKIDDELLRNFFYTYPIQVYTQTGEEGFSEFEARWGADKISYAVAESINKKPLAAVSSMAMSCEPFEKVVYLGDNVTAKCSLNSDRKRSSYICFEDYCKKFEFEQGINSFKIDLKTDDSGFKTYLVKLNNGEASSFLSFMILDKTELNLDHLEFPNMIKYGESSYIDFVLRRTSESIPVNVKIKLEHEFFEQEWNIERIDSNQGFSFSFSGSDLSADKNDFLITVNYEDEKGKKYNFEKKLSIEVYDLTFWQRISLWLNGLIAFVGG